MAIVKQTIIKPNLLQAKAAKGFGKGNRAAAQASNSSGQGKAGCKWCEKGECWTHGQTEKASTKKAAAAPVAQKKVVQAAPAVQKSHLKQKGNGQQNQNQQAQQVASMFQKFMAGKQVDKNQIQQMMGMLQGQNASASSASVPAAQGGDMSKMHLSEFVTQKTGELGTKLNILYTTEQVEGSAPPNQQFVSQVVLMTVNPDKVYTGKPCPNKKLAECSAAAAALRQNGQKLGQAPKAAQKQAQPAKAAQGKSKADKPKKACKWCEKGECWSHGQIEKP